MKKLIIIQQPRDMDVTSQEPSFGGSIATCSSTSCDLSCATKSLTMGFTWDASFFNLWLLYAMTPAIAVNNNMLKAKHIDKNFSER